MPLVDGAVRAGTAGECSLCLGGVFNIFHRLGFLRVRAQEGCIGGRGGVELVCRQRDEGHGEGEFLQEASAGAIDIIPAIKVTWASLRPFAKIPAVARIDAKYSANATDM